MARVLSNWRFKRSANCSSGAHRSDWMFCLTRTSVVPKRQAGITFLLLDMHTPGVAVAAGGAPGAQSSLLKLKGTDIVQRMTEFFVECSGPYAAPWFPEIDRKSVV